MPFFSLRHKRFHKLRCHNSSPSIDSNLHAVNLLVNVLHELDDEVDEFRSNHSFEMDVSDEEGNVVAMKK